MSELENLEAGSRHDLCSGSRPAPGMKVTFTMRPMEHSATAFRRDGIRYDGPGLRLCFSFRDAALVFLLPQS